MRLRDEEIEGEKDWSRGSARERRIEAKGIERQIEKET